MNGSRTAMNSSGEAVAILAEPSASARPTARPTRRDAGPCMRREGRGRGGRRATRAPGSAWLAAGCGATLPARAAFQGGPMRRRSVLLVVLLLAPAAPSVTRAAWLQTGNPLCTVPEDLNAPIGRSSFSCFLQCAGVLTVYW